MNRLTMNSTNEPSHVIFDEPGCYELKCAHCARTTAINVVENESDDWWIAASQVSVGNPTNLICVNASADLSPESEEADWWEWLSKDDGFPETGWVCGACCGNLQFGPDAPAYSN